MSTSIPENYPQEMEIDEPQVCSYYVGSLRLVGVIVPTAQALALVASDVPYGGARAVDLRHVVAPARVHIGRARKQGPVSNRCVRVSRPNLGDISIIYSYCHMVCGLRMIGVITLSWECKQQLNAN